MFRKIVIGLGLLILIALTPTTISPRSAQASGTVGVGAYDDQNSTVVYTGSGWTHGACSGYSTDHCFFNTNSSDSTSNDYLTVAFQGTQVVFYGVQANSFGIGAISIDGGSETNIDFYSATRLGNQLLWQSSPLSNAAHTFKLRVAGTKNASSSGVTIAADRVVIGNSTSTITTIGPTGLFAGTFDDTSAAFLYTGSGWKQSTTCSGCYNNVDTSSNVTNQYVSVSFNGSQILLYGATSSTDGIGAVSIDGDTETNVDFYSSAHAGNQLLWTSPVFMSGPHTFKLRVTGTKNASSSGFSIEPDRVDVVSTIPTPTLPPASPTAPPPTSNGVTLTSSSYAVLPGANITAMWNGATTATSTAWVGVYLVGAANSPSISWNYTNNCTHTAGTTISTAGSCTFTMPTTTGNYNLRLFVDNGYTVLAISNTIVVSNSIPNPTNTPVGATNTPTFTPPTNTATVVSATNTPTATSGPTLTASSYSVARGGSDTATWNGVVSPTKTDWVGVYKVGAANSPSITWEYTDNCTQSAGTTAVSAGSCTFTMPSTAGNYEFRLFANNGYTLLAKSPTIIIQ